MLLPKSWAVSVADFFQDLSASDQVLSCGVEQVEPRHSPWEVNCCVLLPRACLLKIQCLVSVCSCGTTWCALTVVSTAPPRSHPRHPWSVSVIDRSNLCLISHQAVVCSEQGPFGLGNVARWQPPVQGSLCPDC